MDSESLFLLYGWSNTGATAIEIIENRDFIDKLTPISGYNIEFRPLTV
jgi:hypothetical protein